MRKAISLSCLVLFAAVLSCSPSISSVRQWMDSKKTKAGFDITGQWDSGSVFGGGWGGAMFVQTGDHFIGTMGLYNVEGIVSGGDVYMMILSGNGVRYTAFLTRKDDGSIVGTAVEKAMAGSQNARNKVRYPVILKNFTEPAPPEKDAGAQ